MTEIDPPIPDKKNKSPESLSTLAGVLWLFSGSGFQSVFRILVLVVLSRLLTAADFGIVSASWVVVEFSKIFYQLGIGPAIVQRPQLNDDHLRTGFTVSLTLGIIVGAAIALLAPLLALFFRIEGLAPVLQVIALIFPLQGMSVVAQSLLRRDLQFRKLSIIQAVAYALGYGGAGITFALLGFGVWSLVFANIAREGLTTLLLLLYRDHSRRPQFRPAIFRELAHFGGGQTMSQMGNYFASQGDYFVVGRWLGAEALGFYSRAYQMMTLPVSVLGWALEQVLFPSMSRLQDNPKRLLEAYRRSLSLIALIIMPLSALLIILAPEVIRVFLGPGWEATVFPFQILTVGMLFRIGHKIINALTRAAGAVYQNAWRQWVYAVCVVGGAILGSRWGISVVSLLVLGALLVNFLLMAQLSLNCVPMSWRMFAKTQLSALPPTLVVVVVAGLLTPVLRGLDLPAFPLASLVTLAVGLVGLGVWRFAPDWLVTADGQWLLESMFVFISTRLTKRAKREKVRSA